MDWVVKFIILLFCSFDVLLEYISLKISSPFKCVSLLLLYLEPQLAERLLGVGNAPEAGVQRARAVPVRAAHPAGLRARAHLTRRRVVCARAACCGSGTFSQSFRFVKMNDSIVIGSQSLNFCYI